jgi:2-polyprenyl-3-methyl-5-hydroxy-6-metoxy-1,4-benzoquinol methylase
MTLTSNVGYEDKVASYFASCREDFVDTLPSNPHAAILEIGCAYGSTGALALKRQTCTRYVGIEINPAAADVARSRLTEVITGNVEEIELPFQPKSFDVLIVGEVLEHLVDPWSVLRRLASLIKPGGLVLASSPNVSQYRVILQLVRGRWDLADEGVMDRTHLRWFTPQSYVQLFEQAGFVVDEVRPIVPFGLKVQLINWITARRFQHLFIRQISIIGRRIYNP